AARFAYPRPGTRPNGIGDTGNCLAALRRIVANRIESIMSRPAFISLDGLDGTGKSTQCRLLADWLRGSGYAVTTSIDPGGTPLGTQLRSLVLHHRSEMDRMCEALLFMASRAQLLAEVIRPALAAGRIVVSDRFLLANIVYQGHAGGLDVERLWEA